MASVQPPPPPPPPPLPPLRSGYGPVPALPPRPGPYSAFAPQSNPGPATTMPLEERLHSLLDSLLSLPPPRLWPRLVLSTLVLDPLRALALALVALLTSPRTHRALLRLGVLATLLCAAVALAVLAYVGFYRAWVPDVGRMQDVHLEYGRPGQVPRADVDLEKWPWGREWFAEEQEYDVTLEMLVPISAANLDLGNFMVSIDLIADDGTTLLAASKPAILRPNAPPLRLLAQFASQISARPSLVGASIGATGSSILPLPFASPSLELMSINLFHRAVLHQSPSSIPFSNPPGNPLEAAAGATRGGRRRPSRAIVRVGREDADRYWIYGGGHGVGGVVRSGASSDNSNNMLIATSGAGAFRSRGELQTVGVGLRFDARLTGLRYLLYFHPLLSFLLFTSLFLAFELAAALSLWTIAAIYTSTLPGLGVTLDLDLRPDTQYVPARGRGLAPRDASASEQDRTDTESESETETETETETERGGARTRGYPQRTRTRTREEQEALEARFAAVEARLAAGGGGGGGAGGPVPVPVPVPVTPSPSPSSASVSSSPASASASSSSSSALGLAPETSSAESGAGAGAGAGPRTRATREREREPDAEDVLLSPTAYPYRRVLGRLDEETEEETDDLGGGAGASEGESEEGGYAGVRERERDERETISPPPLPASAQRGVVVESGSEGYTDDGYGEESESAEAESATGSGTESQGR